MTSPAWPAVLGTLLRREPLTAEVASWAMDRVMDGEATDAQVAAFVVALRAKGESPEEMDGLAAAMLGHAHRIEVPGPAVDVVGTGGDLAHTVNVSTMAALVAAGAGARVVKHGNRAASSACGTADVLEALGLPLTLTPAQVAEVGARAGITFCFAQVFHPAMRHAAGVRRELGVPTVFNFLGPLTNPAQPGAQAIGCADPRLAAVMAQVFARRGQRALVFRGDDGLDELTTTTTSRVWWVADGQVRERSLDPRELGIPASSPGDLRGADPAFNAAVVRRVLAGEPGPVRDAVLLNAAAALVALEGGDETPVEALRAALERASAAVDGGAAAAVLARWVETAQEVAGRG
ncbi:MAG TPA: anthranilate phosphoribosyltransferase [Actinomycetes bacterium]|nr:anthranilate phosphoribosyltransferase [Actinomycetes bacterium]